MEITANNSFKTTSDSEYGYTCSPCDDEGLNKEAQYFCGECAQFYCNECEQWHKKIRKRHVVWGREHVGQWLQAPIRSLLEDLERCETHPNKALELYCGDHDKLCCHLCVANDHSNCSVVKHIPVLARGFRKTEKFQKLPDEVEKLRNQLKEFKESREKSLKNIDKSRDKVLEDIKDFRKKIIRILDTIEARTITEMKKVMAPLVESLTKDVDKCNDMRDRLKRLKEEIKTKTGKSESLSFVGFTKCQRLMSEANTVCKEMIPSKDYELAFQPGSKVETTVSSIDTFGDIFDANYVFTVQSKTSITIDEDTTAVCEMPNGDIVLCVGEFRSELVLLDENYKALTRLHINAYSEDIYNIGENDVAVVLRSEKDLLLIQVTEGSLQETRRIKFHHICLSVAHHNNLLYVTSGAALFQYTKSGKLVKQLYEHKKVNAKCWGLNVCKCAVNHDGSKIFILNKSANQILTLDRELTIQSFSCTMSIKRVNAHRVCCNQATSMSYCYLALCYKVNI